MNIIRTIQATERKSWVDALFEEERWGREHEPSYPPMIPLPFRLREEVAGSYIYIVYARRVLGYGAISEVRPHRGSLVGSEGNEVAPGDAVYADGAYTRMPERLSWVQVQGFQGIRYTPVALHTLQPAAFRKALKTAGVRVR